MRLGLEASSWSRAINLETLGMHANIHVHGLPPGGLTASPPGIPAEGQGALEAAVPEAIMPRSASPTRRRNVSRCCFQRIPGVRAMSAGCRVQPDMRYGGP